MEPIPIVILGLGLFFFVFYGLLIRRKNKRPEFIKIRAVEKQMEAVETKEELRAVIVAMKTLIEQRELIGVPSWRVQKILKKVEAKITYFKSLHHE